jgi:hypothetical protein
MGDSSLNPLSASPVSILTMPKLLSFYSGLGVLAGATSYLAGSCCEGKREMTLKIERFQPEGMNVRMSAGQPSYSHVVTVSGTGKIVYIAGQLARDIDGNCVGIGDMRADGTDLQKPRSMPQGGRCNLGRRRKD